MEKVSFKTWLLQYTKRADRLGMLARFVEEDEGFPESGDTVNPYIRHFEREGASTQEIVDITSAFNVYQRAQIKAQEVKS